MIKLFLVTGTKLEFVETFTYNFGHFSGRGYGQSETNGYEIRAKGFLKFVAFGLKTRYRFSQRSF